MSSLSTARLALTVMLAAPQSLPAVLPGPPLTGLTIEQTIARFSDGGRRIFFSSDLVRSSMTVLAEPLATDPYDALAEILAPHGLTLRPGLNESWLVVRSPLPEAPRAMPSTPADGAAAERAARAFVPMAVEAVIVQASRFEIMGAQAAPVSTLGAVDLETAPDIGEDAIRAIARLPGMASNGLSSLASVRGGEIEETLLRLDGLKLYDPFHLRDFQGVFSVIDPRVVSSMDVYTGAFPARFGARMSGVIDIETISPPADLYHEIGLSFFNSSILSAGRFFEDRGSWVASARRSNLDILYDRFSDLPERPSYVDAFARLSLDLSGKLSITGSLLHAEDDIALADDVDREERAAASQTDSYAGLRLDHRLGGHLSGATILASTQIDTTRVGTSDKAGVSSGSLADFRSFSIETVRSEWTRIIGARVLLEFGGEVTASHGRYEYEDAVDFDLLFDVDGAPATTSRSRSLSVRPDSRTGSLFSALRLDLSSRLSTELGVRWNRFSVDGVAESFWEPRLGVRFAVSETTALRANWGRFYQPQEVNELQVSDGVPGFLPPQRADHLVLGLDRQLAGGMTLRLEAYVKTMSDLRPRYENLLNSRVLLPELKPDRIGIAPAGAQSRGFEASVDGRRDAWHWWGSIGWSRVEDELEGGDVLRGWDQTYALNAGVLLDLERWSLSSALAYRSGWPTTSVHLDETAPFPTVRASPRNSDRLSAYASLDLRASRHFDLNRSELTAFIELSNVTGRSNPCCIEYEIGQDEDAGQLVLTEQHYLPTIPSLGFTWSF